MATTTVQTKLFSKNFSDDDLVEEIIFGKLWQREELLLIMIPYKNKALSLKKLFEEMKKFEETFPEESIIGISTMSALKRQLKGAIEEKEVKTIGNGFTLSEKSFTLTEKGVEKAKEIIKNLDLLNLKVSWKVFLNKN